MSEKLERLRRSIPRREAVPAPEPGDVFRYDFNWPHETAPKYPRHGIVIAVDEQASPPAVLLIPITTNPPRNPTTSRKINDKVARDLSLTEPVSWVRTDSGNIEKNWPNNVRIIEHGPRAGHTKYGAVPAKTLEILSRDVQRHMARGGLKIVPRRQDDRLSLLERGAAKSRARYRDQIDKRPEREPARDRDDDWQR